MSNTLQAGPHTQQTPLGPVRYVVGDWVVNLLAHQLECADRRVSLEPLHMAVLATMCRRAGEVLSADDLLDACWSGVALGDNPVHKAIASLRKALGDQAASPRYIETIRKQGYRLVAPVRVLGDMGARSHQGSWRSGSPFRGLEPFDATHAEVFYGREKEVADLRRRITQQWLRGHPLLVILGPSGSGKTSLVQAGLIPALYQAGPSAEGELLQISTSAVLDLGSVGEHGVWWALSGALLDWELDGEPLLQGFSVETLGRVLRDDPAQVLAALAAGLGADAGRPERPPLLVLDRLEALFQAGTVPPQDLAHLHQVLAMLVQACRLFVVATCRNDFYSHLAREPLWMTDKSQGAHMDLGPPDGRALAMMIRLPARAAGLVFGQDPDGMRTLDDSLCMDAMGAPDALPLLQYTLQELFNARAPGGELTWRAYEDLGGLEGAIGRRAEATLLALPVPQQSALPGLLTRLVLLQDEEGAATGRRVRWVALDGDAERGLVKALVEARLLVTDFIAGEAGFRVAHEALLRRWPRVTDWVARHRGTLALRHGLAPWVQRWLAAGQSGDQLLPHGDHLAQVRAAVVESPQAFTAEERDFVQQSIRRLQRATGWRWGGAVLVVMLAVYASWAAWRNGQLAETAARRGNDSERLVSFMLGDLADQLRPLGRLALLDGVASQALAVLGGRQGRSAEDLQAAMQRARALVVVAEVNLDKGRVAVAEPALAEAQRLLEDAQARGVADDSVLKTRGAVEFWHGRMAMDRGDLADAQRRLGRYRMLSAQWQAQSPNSREAWIELSYALNSLGSVAIKQGAWQEAARLFEESLSWKEKALAAKPDDTALAADLADTLAWQGFGELAQGRMRQALARLEQVADVLKKLRTQNPGDMVWVRRAGFYDSRRAAVLAGMGRDDEARQVWAGALSMINRAASFDPDNAAIQRGRLRIEAENLVHGGAGTQQALQGLAELQRRLESRAKSGGPRATADLFLSGRLQSLQAILEGRAGNWAGALASLERSQASVNLVIARQPHDWEAMDLRARNALLAARAQFVLGHKGALHELCDEMERYWGAPVTSGYGGAVLEAWLVGKKCLGKFDDIQPWQSRLVSDGYHPSMTDLPVQLEMVGRPAVGKDTKPGI